MKGYHLTDSTILALCAALFLGDLALPALLGPFVPGYSLVHDTLSALGQPQSPVATLTAAWLIAFGLALGGLALLAWQRSPGGKRRNVFFSGLLAFAIGAGVMSGLFAEDLAGGPETLHGKLHGISAGLGTIWFLIALWVGSGDAVGRRRYAIRALLLVATLGFAMFLAANGPGKFAGLWQKLTLAAGYLAALLTLGAQRDR